MDSPINQPTIVEEPKKTLSKLYVLYGGVIFLLIIGGLWLFSLNNNGKKILIKTVPSITITPYIPLSIVSIDPADKAQGVATGEIHLHITTNSPVASKNLISFTISPAVVGYQFDNAFPNDKLDIQLVGGAQPNTTYHATINIANGQPYSWTFTTNSTPPPNSSQEFKKYEQSYLQNKYPLKSYLPITTNDYIMDYSGELSLTVEATNTSTSIDTVKQEVDDWIQSKGIDPATHTINYIDSSGNQIGTQPATK